MSPTFLHLFKKPSISVTRPRPSEVIDTPPGDFQSIWFIPEIQFKTVSYFRLFFPHFLGNFCEQNFMPFKTLQDLTSCIPHILSRYTSMNRSQPNGTYGTLTQRSPYFHFRLFWSNFDLSQFFLLKKLNSLSFKRVF